MTRQQRRFWGSLATLLLALVLAYFGEQQVQEEPPSRPAPPPHTATSSIYHDPLAFGKPVGGGRKSVLLKKPEYVLSYNPARGGPDWVSWELNSSQFGDAERCNCFAGDTSLPRGVPVVVSSDYTGSGYDRGHMVRSEERTSTPEENRATFLMTNILPQTHDLNAGPWLRLEEYMETLARRQARELYIVAGGIYPPNPPTLKDAGKVAIPSAFWKAALVLPAGTAPESVRSAADVRVIAVLMPNITGIQSTAWRQYVTTIGRIEAESGLTLFPALPDSIAAKLKARRGDGR
jgi:endonuclease G